MENSGEANPFDQAQKAEKMAADVEALQSVVSMAEGADGQTYPVSRLDVIHSQWRQTATGILRLVNPEAYKKYRELKYSKGQNPDLATRKAAYEYAVLEFLKLYGVAGF